MPKLVDSKVAARYAKALFDEAIQTSQLDSISADLEAVAQTMVDVPQMASFFANPAISQSEKESFVNEQLVAKVIKPVGNLLKLLLANDRMMITPHVLEQFRTLVNQHQHVAMAEVITAVEADKKQLDQLQVALEKRFGFNRVELKNRVEPGILGGVIVKLQDQIIDGSFSGKLEALKKQLV